MAVSKKKIFLCILSLGIIFLLATGIILYYKKDAVKRVFIAEISERAAAVFGQDVTIQDISVSMSDGLDLYGIRIQNPEGFPEGNLLTIKKLHMGIEYKKLLGKEFDFRDIDLLQPELTLIHDEKGRINISEHFMQSFKKESETHFHIGSVRIEHGAFDLDGKELFRARNIVLELENLSSDPETETRMLGSVSYGESTVSVKGLGYLNAEPKQIEFSMEFENFPGSPAQKILQTPLIRVNIEKIVNNLSLSAAGEAHAQISAEVMLEDTDSKIIEKPVHVPLSADIHTNTQDAFDSLSGTLKFSIPGFSLRGDHQSSLAGEGKFDSEQFSLNVSGKKILGGTADVSIEGTIKDGFFPFHASIDASEINLVPMARILSLFRDVPYGLAGIIEKFDFEGTVNRDLTLTGTSSVRAAKVTVSSPVNGRSIFKEGTIKSSITFKKENVSMTTDVRVGKVNVKADASMKNIMKPERAFSVRLNLPQLDAAEIRNAFWDIFPDQFLYAGLQGMLSSDIDVEYEVNALRIAGKVSLREFVLEGENSEYSIGPVNGEIPVLYSKPAQKASGSIPVFDRSKFGSLYKDFSGYFPENGYSKLTIGSVDYGFRMIEDVNIWMKKHGSALKIEKFDGNIFGGKLLGAALIDFSESIQYRAGFLLKGLSLTALCNRIEPIRGYISGNVDAIGSVKGTGKGLSHVIGKADFWSYATKDEETKISKEFLKKVGGPSLKTYLGDRDFDKGIMKLYLEKGYLIFDEFEISNRNFFGMQDLSIKVALFNNRIAVDHLMWSIVQAAQRAKEKQN